MEPTRGCPHRILSPARLPVPPARHIFRECTPRFNSVASLCHFPDSYLKCEFWKICQNRTTFYKRSTPMTTTDCPGGLLSNVFISSNERERFLIPSGFEPQMPGRSTLRAFYKVFARCLAAGRKKIHGRFSFKNGRRTVRIGDRKIAGENFNSVSAARQSSWRMCYRTSMDLAPGKVIEFEFSFITFP